MMNWPLHCLRVNLTHGDVTLEEIPESYSRMYLGGQGFNTRRLWESVTPGLDALNPDNPLIIGIGPLSGTLAPSSGRFTVTAKSPQTDIFGDSNCGGFFGPEMRCAGYSQIMITGRSEKPAYIFIDDDRVEIRDAGHLWGLDTWETQEQIRAACGVDIQTLCIGTAGENLVRFAGILSGLSSAAGRTGTGAVMGSKNLKALTLRGSRDIPVARPDEFLATCREVFEDIRNGFLPDWCTPNLMEINAALSGGLLTRGGVRDAAWMSGGSGIVKTGGERLIRDFMVKRRACFNCPVACKPVYRVREGPYGGLYGEGPDWGITMIAPTLDVRELEPLLSMNNLFNRYGLDSISFIFMAEWAFRCFENGIISERDTGGLQLEWGNAEAVIHLIRQTAQKEGFGRILAEGERRAPKLLGRGSEVYMDHIKGMSEGPPRIKGGHAPGYITSTRGADHLRALFVPPAVPGDLVEKYFPDLETFGPGTGERGLEGWGRGLKYFENFNAAVNASGLCIFPNSISVGPRNLKDFPEKIARLISSLTGMELEGSDLLRIGERIYNLQKAFNAREGLTVQDDDYSSAKALQDLPHMAKQYPGRVPIDEYYRDREALLSEYYMARGWDPETGLQIRETLAELDLEEVADELERYSALGKRSHVTREGG